MRSFEIILTGQRLCSHGANSCIYIYIYIYTHRRTQKRKQCKTVQTATCMQQGRLCEEGSEKAVPNSNSRAETKAVPNSNSREERKTVLIGLA